jgi:membrane protein
MSYVRTMMGKLKTAAVLAFQAFQEWVRDRCEGLAAALAFNALLAVAPFCAAVLILSAKLFGEPWTRSHVIPALLGWVGPRGAAAIRLLIVQTEDIPPHATLALGIVGTLGLLLGASGFFHQLQDSLGTIWDVRREQAGILFQLRKRVLGLVYAAGSAVIAVAAFAVAGLLFSRAPAVGSPSFPDPLHLAGEALLAWLTFWALATFWFKVLPPVSLTLRQILPWTALIAALHLAGRLVLTWRAAAQVKSTDASTAESLILLLLWFYYANMIFLYGAQLMRLYLQRYEGVGHAPAPKT